MGGGRKETPTRALWGGFLPRGTLLTRLMLMLVDDSRMDEVVDLSAIDTPFEQLLSRVCSKSPRISIPRVQVGVEDW